jgi:plastocyanin
MLRSWIVGVLAAGVIVAPGGDGAAAAEPLQKVTVTAEEFAFQPKEITVRAGRVEFTIRNVGSYAHSMAIVLKGEEAKSPVILKRKTGTFTVDLRPGEYEFYCYQDGHKEEGMVGRLTVRP